MNSDTFIGILALIGSVATMLFLTVWSRRRINDIAGQKSSSARAIRRDLDNGR